MLILTLREGQRLIIGGGMCVIKAVACQNGSVRLAVAAPQDVLVDRESVHLRRLEQDEPTQACALCTPTIRLGIAHQGEQARPEQQQQLQPQDFGDRRIAQVLRTSPEDDT
jgi:sRNA-binding carbon storage regulator CsrA